MRFINAILVSIFTAVSSNSAAIETEEKLSLSVEGEIEEASRRLAPFCPLDDDRSQNCVLFDNGPEGGCGECLDDQPSCERGDTRCEQAALRACKEFCNDVVLAARCGDFCKDCASESQIDALEADFVATCPRNLDPKSPKFYSCLFGLFDIQTLEVLAASACPRLLK